MARPRYIRLGDFLDNIYVELCKAQLTATTFQQEYLNAMNKGGVSVGFADGIFLLSVNSMDVSVHFKVVKTPLGIIDKFLTAIGLGPTYPAGTYLTITNKEKADLIFNISLYRGISGMPEKQNNTDSQFYVFTEVI